MPEDARESLQRGRGDFMGANRFLERIRIHKQRENVGLREHIRQHLNNPLAAAAVDEPVVNNCHAQVGRHAGGRRTVCSKACRRGRIPWLFPRLRTAHGWFLFALAGGFLAAVAWREVILVPHLGAEVPKSPMPRPR